MATSEHALSGKLLVVDDSAFDRARLVAVVKSLGCTPVEVAYADQVLDVARQEQPIMILMDVVMGPPNGFEVCRTLREHPETKHIPVILCSVKSTKVDHDWARRQGAMGYLAKPIDHEKTKDFLQKQWTRFQEALEVSKQKVQRKEARQKQAASSVSEAVRAQQEIQARLEDVRTVASAKPSLGWKSVDTARSASIDPQPPAPATASGVKQEGDGSSR